MGTEMGMVVGRIELGHRECAPSESKPVRYANDLLVTDLARRITNEMAELNALLTDGHLDDAWKKAHAMTKDLEGLKERLNDIKYERA